MIFRFWYRSVINQIDRILESRSLQMLTEPMLWYAAVILLIFTMALEEMKR